MPKTLRNIKPFPQMPRIAQENSNYCGPATVQMLCGFLGHETTQEEIVNAGTTRKKVFAHGITVEELGRAVNNLQIGFSFWLKKHSSITELSEIVNHYHYPVGVEWQGKFDYPEEEAYEDEDDDPGHVSIITHIDTKGNEILIADPYGYYIKKDRYFTILEFERRWWDINNVVDANNRKTGEVDDYHVMFVITPERDFWPEKLLMERYE